MRLPLIAVTAAGLVVAASLPLAAGAQDCGPRTFLDGYRQAEAAYARQDFAATTAALRPLAEQGLGPAQLRLGQALDAAGGTPAEAYRWVALAADVGTPGAKDALATLEPRVDAAARAQAKPAGWQPKLGPCLSVDPHGAGGYAPKVLVNGVFTRAEAKPSSPEIVKWLTDSLEYVRTKSPRHLVYLKSLAGIAFIDRGPFIMVDTREGLPLVVINRELATTAGTNGGKELIGAAVYAVHKQLLPPTVPVETVTYKGRTLRAPATEDGKLFFTTMKQAIDMAETLPPDLATLARAQTDLRYEPHEPYDKRGSSTNLGSSTQDPSGKRYESYSDMFKTLGPSRLVINLVDSGVLLRRSDPAAKGRSKQFNVHERGDCELEDYEIKTMQALKLEDAEINRKVKMRTRRNCG
jgi:hypothetical protein